PAGAFRLACVAHGQIAVIGSGLARPGPAHQWRQADGQEVERELVFPRRIRRQFHIVDHARRRQKPATQRRQPVLCREEGPWEERLVQRGRYELRIAGQEIVQMGGPAAPVAEDEQRRRDGGVADRRAMPRRLVGGQAAVGRAVGSLEQRPPEIPTFYGEAMPPQKPDPVTRAESPEVADEHAHQKWGHEGYVTLESRIAAGTLAPLARSGDEGLVR